MTSIKVRENIPFEQELRRFKRSCDKASISLKFRANKEHLKPTTKRRRAGIEARKAEYNANRKFRELYKTK